MTKDHPSASAPQEGCEECGATDQGVHVEAFEVTGRVLCEECGATEMEGAYVIDPR